MTDWKDRCEDVLRLIEAQEERVPLDGIPEPPLAAYSKGRRDVLDAMRRVLPAMLEAAVKPNGEA